MNSISKFLILLWETSAMKNILLIFNDDSGRVLKNRALRYIEENSKDYNIYIKIK